MSLDTAIQSSQAQESTIGNDAMLGLTNAHPQAQVIDELIESTLIEQTTTTAQAQDVHDPIVQNGNTNVPKTDFVHSPQPVSAPATSETSLNRPQPVARAESGTVFRLKLIPSAQADTLQRATASRSQTPTQNAQKDQTDDSIQNQTGSDAPRSDDPIEVQVSNTKLPIQDIYADIPRSMIPFDFHNAMAMPSVSQVASTSKHVFAKHPHTYATPSADLQALLPQTYAGLSLPSIQARKVYEINSASDSEDKTKSQKLASRKTGSRATSRSVNSVDQHHLHPKDESTPKQRRVKTIYDAPKPIVFVSHLPPLARYRIVDYESPDDKSNLDFSALSSPVPELRETPEVAGIAKVPEVPQVSVPQISVPSSISEVTQAPEISKPEIPQPEVIQPEMPQPEMSQPEKPQPPLLVEAPVQSPRYPELEALFADDETLVERELIKAPIPSSVSAKDDVQKSKLPHTAQIANNTKFKAASGASRSATPTQEHRASVDGTAQDRRTSGSDPDASTTESHDSSLSTRATIRISNTVSPTRKKVLQDLLRLIRGLNQYQRLAFVRLARTREPDIDKHISNLPTGPGGYIDDEIILRLTSALPDIDIWSFADTCASQESVPLTRQPGAQLGVAIRSKASQKARSPASQSSLSTGKSTLYSATLEAPSNDMTNSASKSVKRKLQDSYKRQDLPAFKRIRDELSDEDIQGPIPVTHTVTSVKKKTGEASQRRSMPNTTTKMEAILSAPSKPDMWKQYGRHIIMQLHKNPDWSNYAAWNMPIKLREAQTLFVETMKGRFQDMRNNKATALPAAYLQACLSAFEGQAVPAWLQDALNQRRSMDSNTDIY